VRHLVKTLTALAATAALIWSAPSTAGAAAPETELRPGALPRGADIAIPHIAYGKKHDALVDGALRIPLPPGDGFLLGRSGRAYIVVLTDREGDARTLRVRRDGSRKVLLRHVGQFDQVVSRDGHQLVAGFFLSADASRVKVYDARSGNLLRQRKFAGQRQVLDASHGRVVLGGFHPKRTLLWREGTGSVRILNRRAGYEASFPADRIASYTRDPYDGGCSVVTRLSDPSVELWRSCKERVDVFSPQGRRMATIPLLTDGLGPRDVHVRKARGREQAHYTTQGWFGLLRWEDDHTLLLETTGKKWFATVRCESPWAGTADCERASKLMPRPDL
jgi:hypothetical protein